VSGVAVVTGGAGGIGRAIARRLIAAGHRVALWDRDRAALAAIDLDVARIEVDVVDSAEVARATAATAALGPIEVAVVNAGVLGPVMPLWEHGDADWARVLDVNLTGAFKTLRALVPEMRRHPGRVRRIVTISSIQAKEGMALGAAYGASKAGLIALTKTLGKELAGDGILVNCVTPSAVETAMAREITAERRADITSRIPLGRFLEADEVAAMVAWLASAENSFATGAVFDQSGGRATY
jgi:3-oxoacyl-[acyl-carrier protein] reductase